MYCPSCGSQNGDRDDFCAFCGAKLESNAPRSQGEEYMDRFKEKVGEGAGKVQKLMGKAVDEAKKIDKEEAKKKIMRPKVLVPLIIGAVLVVALIASLVAGSIITNPERTAKNYFKCLINQDYEKMYKYAAIDESALIDKDLFAEYIKKNYSYVTANSYDIYEGNNLGQDDYYSGRKSLVKYYYAEYINNSRSGTFQMVLNEQGRFLFFRKYAVSLADDIINDITLEVPAGAVVTIDGKVLDKSMMNEVRTKENWSDIYKIECMFKGMHQVKLEGGICNGETSTMGFENSGAVYNRVEDYIGDAAFNVASSQAKSMCDSMTKGAFENKRFADLGINSKFKMAESEYANLFDDMPSRTIESVSDIITSIEDIGYYDGVIRVKAKTRYNYSYSYTYWSGTETVSDSDWHTFELQFAYDPTTNSLVVF